MQGSHDAALPADALAAATQPPVLSAATPSTRACHDHGGHRHDHGGTRSDLGGRRHDHGLTRSDLTAPHRGPDSRRPTRSAG